MKRRPLYRYEDHLHQEIITYGWGIAFYSSAITCGLLLLTYIIPVPLLISLAFGAIIFAFLGLLISGGARRVVLDFAEFMRKRRARSIKIQPPFERLPPVATASCMSCLVQIGERHHRTCPTVPPAWFKR